MDYTTFNAQAAKELAISNQISAFESVMVAIKRTAESGKFSITLNNLSEYTLERLREMGYGVNVRYLKTSGNIVGVKW